MKRLLLGMTLVLTLGTAALAVEPAAKASSGTAPVAASSAALQALSPAAAPAPAVPAAAKAPAPAASPGLKTNRVITIGMFVFIIGITMGIVVWAARQTTSAADFYAAGG